MCSLAVLLGNSYWKGKQQTARVGDCWTRGASDLDDVAGASVAVVAGVQPHWMCVGGSQVAWRWAGAAEWMVQPLPTMQWSG